MLLAVAKKSTALRTENVKTTAEFGLILLVAGLASPATRHTVIHVRNSVETVRQNVTMMLLAVAKKSTALRMDNVKTTVEFGLILLVVGLASPATKHMVETEISTEATEITMEAALPCQATRIITTRTRLQVTHSTPSTRLPCQATRIITTRTRLQV